jgi:hypothetical protein
VLKEECGCTSGGRAVATLSASSSAASGGTAAPTTTSSSKKKKKEQKQPPIPDLPEMQGLAPYFDTHTHLDQILPRVLPPFIYFIFNIYILLNLHNPSKYNFVLFCTIYENLVTELKILNGNK